MSAGSFRSNEADIRRFWSADRPFNAQDDGFDRLSALAMLAEIEELSGRLRLACNPCAECGHIDYRELDDCLPESYVPFNGLRHGEHYL